MTHEVAPIARQLSLGTGQATRQKKQNRDYGIARSDRKARAKKALIKYKGVQSMKYSGKNKPITSIADRMQARRRARNR